MGRMTLAIVGLCARGKGQQNREALNNGTRVQWDGTDGPSERFGVQERGEADCFVEIVGWGCGSRSDGGRRGGRGRGHVEIWRGVIGGSIRQSKKVMLNLDKVLIEGARVKQDPVVGDDVRNGVIEALEAEDDGLELRGDVRLHKNFQEVVSSRPGLRVW